MSTYKCGKPYICWSTNYAKLSSPILTLFQLLIILAFVNKEKIWKTGSIFSTICRSRNSEIRTTMFLKPFQFWQNIKKMNEVLIIEKWNSHKKPCNFNQKQEIIESKITDQMTRFRISATIFGIKYSKIDHIKFLEDSLLKVEGIYSALALKVFLAFVTNTVQREN